MVLNPASPTIDPEWAWSQYVPSPEQPWSVRLAAHLHRRAGFGATFRELESSLAQTPAAAVAAICVAEEPQSLRVEMEGLARTSLSGGDPRRLPAWWLYRQLATPAPFREQMTLFWHGHFATSASKVTDVELMYRQNELFRRLALGEFGVLVHEVSRDPAMLLWLDAAASRKLHPNENFARELMELFCLGEGEYSEQDIRELARCFTGWEVRRGKFRINAEQQDQGLKSILGATGAFDGKAGIDVVLRQPATSRFVVQKLVRHFVSDGPGPSPALMEPLVRQFREDGLQVGPLVQRILGSNLFFSKHALGRKIRSPVDLVVGLLRSLSGTVNAVHLAHELSKLGQDLFFPPNVKGWDGGKTWINSSTLLGRANLIQELLSAGTTRFAGGSLRESFQRQGLGDGPAIVGRLDELLFAVPLPAAARTRAIELIDRPQGDRDRNLRAALHLLCTLPEFQLA